MITIILADDDPIVVQGLTMILSSSPDFSVIGAASNGAEAIDLARRLGPDVAILDIRMPGTDGIEAAEVMLAEGLCAPLLLTTFDEPALIQRAIGAGAMGYILKNSPAERIVSAVKTVAEGGTVFAPDVADYIRRTMAGRGAASSSDVFAELTPRENEIVALIAEGLSNAQIAEKLFLADGTVRNHVSAILEKTDLEHRTQIAVQYYMAQY
jgi:DNA-binding NarL/FixJ family response regulator